MHLRFLVSAKVAPTLYDPRCFVREAIMLWIQSEMPDAVPAQRTLLDEIATETERRSHRGKRAAPAEHSSDEGRASASPSLKSLRVSSCTAGRAVIR